MSMPVIKSNKCATHGPFQGVSCYFCVTNTESDDDRVPREPGCQCHLEIGDSPCPVHGEEEYFI